MIGIPLTGFVTLTIISATCAFIIHNILRYRAITGPEGFFTKFVVGWVGAWIASPVLGYWSLSVPGTNLYLIPAILGSFGAILFEVAVARNLACVLAYATTPQTVVRPGEERRIA